MTNEDREYFRARAQEERTKAAAAASTLIGAIHDQMAQRYLAWSEGIDPDGMLNGKEDPSNDDDADEGSFRQIPRSGQA